MVWPLVFFIGGISAVSAGCLIPARWCPQLPNDKLMHFAAFGTLALTSGLLTDRTGPLLGLQGGLFLAGAGIELLQNLVPGRQFCWHDLLANTAGIALATIVLFVFNPFG